VTPSSADRTADLREQREEEQERSSTFYWATVCVTFGFLASASAFWTDLVEAPRDAATWRFTLFVAAAGVGLLGCICGIVAAARRLVRTLRRMDQKLGALHTAPGARVAPLSPAGQSSHFSPMLASRSTRRNAVMPISPNDFAGT
jgi:hypothetical protein